MMPSEINQDPVQGEFFTSASDLSERVVRESLQNSLDARRGHEPVRVRFTFSGESGALPTDAAARYLRQLAPHIQADPSADAAERDAIDEALARLAGPMPWVTVEDFGTTGLAGDIEANDPNEPGNHFWGFFRSIGISPKGEDADTRWALAWFEQAGFADGEYGLAETLATAKDISIAGMVEAGILRSGTGKVHLLRPGELPADWDPAQDARLTVWEMVHHLIRVHGQEGEAAAAALAAKLGSKAEDARYLAYRLYRICDQKRRAQEALSYNALIQSWPEIARLSQESGQAQQQTYLESTVG